jgi:hypothetical protein
VPVFAHLEGWSFIESFYFGERQMAGERAHVMPLLPVVALHKATVRHEHPSPPPLPP